MEMSFSFILYLTFHCWNIVSIYADSSYKGKCNFKQTSDHPVFTALKKMEGESYTIKPKDDHYTYHIGICTTSTKDDIGSEFETAAVTQVDHDNGNKKKNCGKYTDADFMQGNDWLLLTYGGGNAYSEWHCNGNPRSTQLMIICDPELKGHENGKLTFIEEASAKNDSCYYLFELSHYAACNAEHHDKTAHSLSVGSILCIVFFSLVAVYLIVGLIVQRVRGAQGWEQVPNYTFWKAVGNYAADGCDVVFRSSDRGSREYRGVGGADTMDQEIPRSTEPDDHLLSM